MPWREAAAERARGLAERPEVIATPLGELYGILTPPAPDVPARGRAVILLTRPRSHRNRMWVEGARRLALGGHHAFRFDYHGCGDSGGESGYLDPNRPYRDDVVAVIRHLRAAHGLGRFVLYGSCFDARTALSAFMDEGAAIDGLVFAAAPVVELADMAVVRADQRDLKGLAGTLGNPENWRALARPERWAYMARVVARVAANALRGSKPPPGPPLSASFREHFDALVRSRARALFLYGREDDEYRTFRGAEEGLFPRLRAADRGRFEIEVWPGRVHGFLEIPRQRETLERVLGWIESLPVSPGA